MLLDVLYVYYVLKYQLQMPHRGVIVKYSNEHKQPLTTSL